MTDKFAHIMIDLETLSTNYNALVLSIGASVFEVSGEKENFYSKVDTQFYTVVSQKDQVGLRDISQSTLDWWEYQEPEARKVLDESKAKLTSATEDLIEFADWLNRIKSAGYTPIIWGNGAAFDNIVLKSLYTDLGLECPWSYKFDYCYRTFRAMYGHKIDWEVLPEVLKHHALGDAHFQAMAVCQVLSPEELHQMGTNGGQK